MEVKVSFEFEKEICRSTSKKDQTIHIKHLPPGGSNFTKDLDIVTDI